MKRFLMAGLLLTSLCQSTTAQTKNVSLRIIQTSDVHGAFFPYDFIERRPKSGSMARVITYVDSLRQTYGRNLLLFDNGDILQGQPTCYYCNFMRPEIENVAAKVINYMQFDAQTIGNHDIETGHAVYDKWIQEVFCPMLGANIIDTHTNKPYVEPYAIFERQGVKIAVIGLLTPAIPNWLHEKLWEGLRFDEMVSSARYWIEYLKKNEQPDVVIGLFHSGREGGITTADYKEDASLRIAREVAGFDLILFGHDHTRYADVVQNVEGNDVVCLDPSSNAYMVSDAQIELTLKNGKVVKKKVTGDVVDIRGQAISEDFMAHFKDDIEDINTFVNRKIGTFTNTIYTRDSYFGSSAFSDFIHNLQLKHTGADISLNAPLNFDAKINAGDVHMSDMFNLYRYENQIYVMKLSGEEVRKALEMSYDQ